MTAGMSCQQPQAANPFVMGCEPELDKTTVLKPDQAWYYQSIIGMMRWMCEIGQIDIVTEVSLLSSYVAYPREGHLDAALHMMGFALYRSYVQWQPILQSGTPTTMLNHSN